MFGVFTFTLTNFIAKILFFQRVLRVYKRVRRNYRGAVGDYFTGQIMDVRGGGVGRGRAYGKFPPWWGVDIFRTTQLRLHNKDHLSEVTVNHKTQDDRINCYSQKQKHLSKHFN